MHLFGMNLRFFQINYVYLSLFYWVAYSSTKCWVWHGFYIQVHAVSCRHRYNEKIASPRKIGHQYIGWILVRKSMSQSQSCDSTTSYINRIVHSPSRVWYWLWNQPQYQYPIQLIAKSSRVTLGERAIKDWLQFTCSAVLYLNRPYVDETILQESATRLSISTGMARESKLSCS